MEAYNVRWKTAFTSGLLLACQEAIRRYIKSAASSAMLRQHQKQQISWSVK